MVDRIWSTEIGRQIIGRQKIVERQCSTENGQDQWIIKGWAINIDKKECKKDRPIKFDQ